MDLTNRHLKVSDQRRCPLKKGQKFHIRMCVLRSNVILTNLYDFISDSQLRPLVFGVQENHLQNIQVGDFRSRTDFDLPQLTAKSQRKSHGNPETFVL